MPSRFPLTGLALAFSLLLSGCFDKTEEQQLTALKVKADQLEKKVEAIQDPQLKEAVTTLGASLLMIQRIALEMQTKPVETEYGEDVMALLKDYPDSQAVTDTYINGLFIQRRTSDSDFLTTLEPIFPFSFRSPDEFPFPHNVDWKSVTLDNQKVVPFSKDREEEATELQLVPATDSETATNDLELIYPYKDDALPPIQKNKPNPVTLIGELQVVTPRKVSSFELTKKDVGAKRADDNITVTLLSLDKNFAEVEIENSADLPDELVDEELNPLVVQAQDKTGQFLTRAGGITQNPSQVTFYEKKLDALMEQKQLTPEFQAQLNAEMHTFHRQQKTHYAKVYFNGMVDKVDVSVLDYSQTKISKTELSVPIRQFDEHTFGLEVQPLLLPVVVYDNQAADFLKTYDMNEEQLKKSIVIHQDVENLEDAKIEFSHPQTFNEELVGSSLSIDDSPIAFYAQGADDKPGSKIDLPLDSYELDVAQGDISYDLTQFPQLPAYAKGMMPLFLANIEKSFMDVAELPKGLSLKGNALVIDQAAFPTDTWRFYAKDNSGKYLKEILAVSHQASQYSENVFDVHYFYGQPTSLEAYQRTDLKRVDYNFQVKLDKPNAASLEQLNQNTPATPDDDDE
ncbi:hypothetical protein QN386_11215 [Pseudomonas sp. CCI3.2]|uniref:hypothetical protein n=1 Tax=unclassified Pseudomonas TaxID=196821 RepID=UPI002AC97C8C|nr:MULTISPECIES: hypothetical protein [unclassified Pseudomonas]MEB0076755.1 hypothetical protein [Pseudomonas sp. MH10out]MEB0101888.1 hypothetical protein [Pseudomonas sp. CCI3.2]MEB0131125.1 hypothetical protein [Pseudomonas sp. CCI2.4]MEB0157114.1 hypothetical protein [Pseudomonas sp. AH2 (2023)]MEB0167502.1 hypothetical protein [Pseudomonas sp. CCC4.4]